MNNNKKPIEDKIKDKHIPKKDYIKIYSNVAKFRKNEKCNLAAEGQH